MADSFRSLDTFNDPRPTEAMSRAQCGLILGLEGILREAGLVLVCPRCAANGHSRLDTNNDIGDEIWKIDCQCRRRRIARMDSRMTSTGWLLLMVEDLLAPLGLDVRCPSPKCLTKPLKMHQSADGRTVTVTCHCGGSFKFQKTQPTKPH